MKSILVLSLACFSNSVFAAPGEVKEINRDTLQAFHSVPSADCNEGLFIDYTIWFAIDYRDGAVPRRLAFPIRRTSSVCQAAKDIAQADLGTHNLFFNDVLRGNLAVEQGICMEKYAVATLEAEVTLPDGTKADQASIVKSYKATKCP